MFILLERALLGKICLDLNNRDLVLRLPGNEILSLVRLLASKLRLLPSPYDSLKIVVFLQ